MGETRYGEKEACVSALDSANCSGAGEPCVSAMTMSNWLSPERCETTVGLDEGFRASIKENGTIWKRRTVEDVAIRVAAIVITHDPDLTRLEENLTAIAPQVDIVLIHDNASRDREVLASLLSRKACLYTLCDENVGLSKALNTACFMARELGASHVVLLDQDSVAGDGMVKGLLSQDGPGVALVSPQIVDRNKREGFLPGDATNSVKRAITSGALISLDAWETVGGFDERLFLDWVDYDFSANLRAHGYRIIRNNQVMLLHEMGRREYAFSLITPKGLRAFYRTNHELSRQQDKARSWAIVKSKYGWSKIGREERLYIASIKLRDLVLERGRVEIFKAFANGKREGNAVIGEKQPPL